MPIKVKEETLKPLTFDEQALKIIISLKINFQIANKNQNDVWFNMNDKKNHSN